MSKKPLRIGIVAGEASGDLLGAGLITAFKQYFPDSVFEGIAGPAMMEQGAKSLFPMDRLSVMGIFEVLGRYRELLGIRRQLVKHFQNNPPDVFIGIDAPDFNLGLEQQLKTTGIKTVHYVSPSVWAWRQKRVNKIANSTDLMLVLFPFEAQFYEQHHVPVRFVGHPLADQIPLETDKIEARRSLSLPESGEVLAVLPGSRSNELNYLAEPFIETVIWLHKHKPGLEVVVPLVNLNRRRQFEQAMANVKDIPAMKLLDGRSHEAMAAADVVLMASGTATLEAMLVKRPMVVAYKLSPLTYCIARQMVKVENISLPNLLSGENLVPEFIQYEVTPEKMGKAILKFFENKESVKRIIKHFGEVHAQLRQDASRKAAQAISELIGVDISP